MAFYTYDEKLKESQDKDLHKYLDEVYVSLFPERSVVRLEYDDNLKFQRGGRDLRVILKKTGKDLFDLHIQETIEEKITSPKYADYKTIVLEYISNKQFGTLGWIYTSEADWLSYVKQPPGFIEVFLLPMQDLKRWFFVNKHRYRDIEANTVVGSSFYTTVCKVVPLQDPYFQRFLAAHGCFHTKVERE
jgi:hypothetical protein